LARCRGVFRGALCLQLGGVEDAIVAPGADSQGLGIAFEGVRRWFRSLIGDANGARIRGSFRVVALELGKNKADIGAALFDGFRLDEAFHSQIGLISLFAHGLHLGDGDVIALAGSSAGKSEVANGAEDDHRCNADADLLRRKLHSNPEFPGIAEPKTIEKMPVLLYEAKDAGSI
jgi:hypothetical protein